MGGLALEHEDGGGDVPAREARHSGQVGPDEVQGHRGVVLASSHVTAALEVELRERLTAAALVGAVACNLKAKKILSI